MTLSRCCALLTRSGLGPTMGPALGGACRRAIGTPDGPAGDATHNSANGTATLANQCPDAWRNETAGDRAMS